MRSYLEEKNGIECPERSESPAEMSEEEVKQLLSRPKVDPYDLIPKPDVGNMEELFHDMTEDEVKQYKLNRVLRHVTSSPYWQSFELDNFLSH